MAVDVGSAIAYLDLDITNFQSGITAASSALTAWSRDAERTVGGLVTSIGSSLSTLGSTMTRTMTVPLVNLAQSSIDAARSYETAFTGVRKTVDATESEFETLSKNIQQMATETASSAEEIAGVMEIAGQLGVQLGENGEDITNFTKTMIELGDSTNLTAAEAAESLAKFMNITGTAVDEVDNLGSAVVDLGNNFATNESDIVMMSTRLASAGTVAGLTEQEILALATAMSSVGIRAEAGGSAMSTTLTNIEQIVQGVAEHSAEKLETLAEVSGMSAEEFSDAWKNEPMEALTAFLYGLGQVNEADESMIVKLDELGMTGVRQSNMLRALGLSSELLGDAINTANEAWDENTALTIEAEKRYATLDSKISQLNESWKQVKRDLAEILIPYLEILMDKVKELISWWNSLSEEQQRYIVKIATIAAAVGPIISAFGRIISIIGIVMQTVSALGNVIGMVGGSASASLLSVLGPATAIVAAIGFLVAAFIKAYNESEVFRESIAKLGELITRVINLLMEIFQKIWQMAAPIFEKVVEILAELLEILLPPLVDLLSAIMDLIEALMPILELMLNNFLKQFLMQLKILEPLLEVIAALIGVTVEIIAILVEALAQLINWIVDLVKNIVTGADEWGEAWDNFIAFAENALNTIASAISGFIIDALGSIFEFLGSLLSSILEFIGNVLGHTAEFLANLLITIIEFFVNVLSDLVSFFANLMLNMSQFFINVVSSIVSFFANIFSSLGTFILNTFNAVVNFFSNIFSSVGTFISNIVNAVINLFSDLFNGTGSFFQRLVNALSNFIKNIFSAVTTFISSIFGAIGTFFTNIFSNLGKFLSSVFSAISQWFTSMWSSVTQWFQNIMSNFYNFGKNMLSNLWNGLKDMWANIWKWIKDIWSDVTGVFNNIKSGFSNAFSGVNGSHANGLDYVPFDGYVAELHQGERVLTKSEAEVYNNNDSNGSGGNTINIYSYEKLDEYESARQMKRALRQMELGF